jgi:hypothetical protein
MRKMFKIGLKVSDVGESYILCCAIGIYFKMNSFLENHIFPFYIPTNYDLGHAVA